MQSSSIFIHFHCLKLGWNGPSGFAGWLCCSSQSRCSTSSQWRLHGSLRRWHHGASANMCTHGDMAGTGGGGKGTNEKMSTLTRVFAGKCVHLCILWRVHQDEACKFFNLSRGSMGLKNIIPLLLLIWVKDGGKTGSWPFFIPFKSRSPLRRMA